MSEKLENPTAFPASVEQCNNIAAESGMSLRDYFAAKAMQGIVSDSEYGRGVDNYIEAVSELSYNIADAMLEQRNK